MGHEISRSKKMVAECFENEAGFSFEKGILIVNLCSQHMCYLLKY